MIFRSNWTRSRSSGRAYPVAVVDIELSNVVAGGGVFSEGLLASLTFGSPSPRRSKQAPTEAHGADGNHKLIPDVISGVQFIDGKRKLLPDADSSSTRFDNISGHGPT